LGGIDKRTIYLIDKNGIVRYPNLKFRASAKEDYQLLRWSDQATRPTLEVVEIGAGALNIEAAFGSRNENLKDNT
jgi:hypothetical protein